MFVFILIYQILTEKQKYLMKTNKSTSAIIRQYLQKVPNEKHFETVEIWLYDLLKSKFHNS